MKKMSPEGGKYIKSKKFVYCMVIYYKIISKTKLSFDEHFVNFVPSVY